MVLNPALMKPDDDVAITKNFGPSKWNTKDSGLETDEEVDEESREDIFEGHADDAGKANVKSVLEMAWINQEDKDQSQNDLLIFYLNLT